MNEETRLEAQASATGIIKSIIASNDAFKTMSYDELLVKLPELYEAVFQVTLSQLQDSEAAK